MQFLLPEFAENGGSFETSEVGKSIDDKLTSILEGDSRRFEISSFSTNDQRFFLCPYCEVIFVLHRISINKKVNKIQNGKFIFVVIL